MKDRCFCFGVFGKDTKYPQWLVVLLVYSIRKFNSDDLYCLTDIKYINPKLLLYLKRYCNISFVDISNLLETSDKEYIHLRNYICWYFSYVKDLTEYYTNVIYLDIDVCLLNSITFILPDNNIIVEPIPEKIRHYEYKKGSGVNNPKFMNWCDIITSRNKSIHLYDFSNADTICEQYDYNVEKSKLKKIIMPYSSIYPVRPIQTNTIFFHYDDLTFTSYFDKLKITKYYNEYSSILRKYYTIPTRANFWKKLS